MKHIAPINDRLCRVCGDELNDDNWYASSQKKRDYICKECNGERTRLWIRENPEKAKAQGIRHIRKMGALPMSKNKECASYLGVHIAERVLSHAFKNVEIMPYNNPGYDFVCNKGMLVDSKSSCLGKNGSWLFGIRRNTIPDYFIFLAFDNRKDLNTLHAWLIPGYKVNHFTSLAIRPSTIHKWDEYKLDITKISACCDTMKDGDSEDFKYHHDAL